MQMTKLQSIIIVIGYLCFAVTYGCTCQSRTSLHSYCRADWVSHLRVKLRVTKQPMPNDPLRKALTNIRYGVHHIRLYKVPPQFTNSTLPAEIFTPSEAAACGLLLEAGKEYLLTGRVRNGTLITMLCGQIIGNRSLRSSFESILEWTMVNETLRQWLERDNSANCPRTLASTTIIAHETMIGGWKEQNVDDKDLQDLSWRAMKGINEQSNDIYHLMPVKLLSAKSQVVAGMKYELEILVGQSECRKNQLSSEDVNAESCKEKAGGRRQVYIVTVWQKPWENFEQFTIKEIKEAS